MSKPERLFDVYISYPPGIDHRQVDSTIRQHLTEEEADEVIRALEEHPQAIIAERCTNEERLNAQNYFGYLGLDVIIRISLELMEDPDEEHSKADALVPQCPVCFTIFEDPDTTECPTCHLHLKTATEAFIYRKRIEWQERLAFEHRKQHEIAYRMLREKQAEERKIRNQIRNELETELLQELGILSGWQTVLYDKRVLFVSLAVFVLVLIFFSAGYLLAKLLS
ncbi:Uncharacterised protein [Kingella potus]|uniref:Uncharacterized protein n=1 Tax=Kingella potus TaxID=265175 RepID=A0A377R2Q1_9NEIS|nr:hypothetical protein [Kingella potus]UOP00181.1 hypothetical protein LVJ84_09580 [Kingella potus]STR02756.1 Uncharacterised protein [Kingella potus]